MYLVCILFIFRFRGIVLSILILSILMQLLVWTCLSAGCNITKEGKAIRICLGKKSRTELRALFGFVLVPVNTERLQAATATQEG